MAPDASGLASSSTSTSPKISVFLVGLGMVGCSWIEKMLIADESARRYFIRTVGEEPHYAYNRVGLTGELGASSSNDEGRDQRVTSADPRILPHIASVAPSAFDRILPAPKC